MSINIAKLAKKLGKTLLTVLDSTSPIERLRQITTQLNAKMPQSAKSMIDQLATKEAMRKLFSNAAELDDVLPALNGCCFIIN